MRCWKSALEQIYDHNANKLPSNYTARSETERALVESLRQLELQCKERIDLLEALRLSRQEDSTLQESSSAGSGLQPLEPSDSEPRGRGWIGCGTIPAITYPELSRPAVPPKPLSLSPMRTTSQQGATPGSSRREERGVDIVSSHSSSAKPQSPVTIPAPGHKVSRSPSPERYSMRTTLRSSKQGEKVTKPSVKRSTPKPASGPGANKAATLAWSALGLGEKAGKAAMSTAVSTPVPSTRNSSEPPQRPSAHPRAQWDSNSRRLVTPRNGNVHGSLESRSSIDSPPMRHLDEYPFPQPPSLSVSAASSALSSLALKGPAERSSLDSERPSRQQRTASSADPLDRMDRFAAMGSGQYDATRESNHTLSQSRKFSSDPPIRRDSPGQSLPVVNRVGTPSRVSNSTAMAQPAIRRKAVQKKRAQQSSSSSTDEGRPPTRDGSPRRSGKEKRRAGSSLAGFQASSDDSSDDENARAAKAWKKRKAQILKNLPQGVDEHAAKQILNEIIVRGDEVHWSDVAGLEIAKNALREAVVYPFLRPDLFQGLREPARGMLLFGPPGTGKTMLARAVATESKSTFFSISASSLTSKYLGESEKLVRALFSLAKALAPSIIFVDEIDSLLSQRSGSGENEATRRIKTEFLIQWSDLQRAAAGRESSDKSQEQGDVNRVLVLAATNLPWAIDEAARRRFVRRQYIPLPESQTRETQLRTLLGQQKHNLTDASIKQLVSLTDGKLLNPGDPTVEGGGGVNEMIELVLTPAQGFLALI